MLSSRKEGEVCTEGRRIMLLSVASLLSNEQKGDNKELGPGSDMQFSSQETRHAYVLLNTEAEVVIPPHLLRHLQRPQDTPLNASSCSE